MADSIVTIENVSLKYKKTVLTNVTISANKGEVIGLLGLNGSGKSTLAKQMNALLLPTQGTVYLLERNTLEEKELWRIRKDAGDRERLQHDVRVRAAKAKSEFDKLKETYTDEALEMMRDSCDNARDLAMIDILSSTGMRVGELVKLNRDDIDFQNRECIVTGKGNKQRIVYFDARTKIHLQNYLRQRKDDNEALFVTLLAPFNRLQISGVEIRLRNIGKDLNMTKVHPHKFRRTLATMAIDKGMPIEQVQHLLGHQSLDTTLQYAMVNQANVKMSHRKFIG